MKKDIIYFLQSPYREPLDVVGFRFGGGKKAMAVVGAMRGNEVQQMYVCSRLVRELKAIEEAGELTNGMEILVVPCVNYYSMNIAKRFWTMDNTDINRMFPGYDLGETTQRIADGVFKAIEGYEFGVQLASFYQPGSFLPHVKLMETGFTDKNLMMDFGLRYSIVRQPRPYDTATLNYNWQIWETKAFSLYSNSTATIDKQGADEAVDAILRFLYKNGIISRKVRPGYESEIINESGIKQIHAPCGGIFESKTEIGAKVKAGQVIAKIRDPFENTVNGSIESPCNGIIYYQYSNPLVNAATVCFKIITQ